LKSITRESWLQAHAYLEPLAAFCAEVDAAAARFGSEPARLPDWDEYRDEYHAGVPLLQSVAAAVDLEPAGRGTVALVRELARRRLAGALADDLRVTSDELRGDPVAPARIASWLLGNADFAPARPGLLRFLAWSCAVRHLRPVLDAFAGWRNEERWLRNVCPGCGSLPAMAQLIGVDPGRMRFLVCGACTTRWRYSRTGCPFCEADSRRLAVVAIEGEGGLRLDWCESCRAYLKTCEGQGADELLLADWSSLHLDVLAQDRGLVRKAASLYAFGAGAAPSPAARDAGP
jgi:FdhE protein